MCNRERKKERKKENKNKHIAHHNASPNIQGQAQVDVANVLVLLALLRLFAAKNRSAVPKTRTQYITHNTQHKTKKDPSSSSSMAEANGGDKPLQNISDAFKGLASVVADSQTAEMELAPFSRACSLVCPLFGCLGIAFKFAEMDFVAKVPMFGSPENENSVKKLNFYSLIMWR